MKSNGFSKVMHQAGVSIRMKALIEIARHSKSGMSNAVVAERISCTRQAIVPHIRALVDANLITCAYESQGGHVCRVCRVTPYGVDVFIKEMEKIVTMMKSVRKDLITAGCGPDAAKHR